MVVVTTCPSPPRIVVLKNKPSLGGLEPPTFRLTAERANRLRHRDLILPYRHVVYDTIYVENFLLNGKRSCIVQVNC